MAPASVAVKTPKRTPPTMIAGRISEATIFPEPKFSDHAPCLVEYAE